MCTGVHEKTLLALECDVAFFNSGIFEANLKNFLKRPLFGFFGL
jgi:hypothetical protein